jgi:hypothetical protein
MSDNTYFIDSDKLYDYFPDSLITTDEFEILRGRIVDEIRYLDYEEVEKYYLSRGLPFLGTFEYYLEEKLVKSGLKREWLNNEIWLKCEAYSRRADYDNPDIAAGLAGLVSIRKLKDILTTDSKIDKKAIRVFLYSLETIINLFRAGAVPKLARAEVSKTENSLKTRELKKYLMKEAISNIFKLKPETKKTLGGVWKEFDTVNKDMTFYTSKSDIHRLGKGGYTVKKGKDKKGAAVIFILKDKKIFCDPYAKK